MECCVSDPFYVIDHVVHGIDSNGTSLQQFFEGLEAPVIGVHYFRALQEIRVDFLVCLFEGLQVVDARAVIVLCKLRE